MNSTMEIWLDEMMNKNGVIDDVIDDLVSDINDDESNNKEELDINYKVPIQLEFDFE